MWCQTTHVQMCSKTYHLSLPKFCVWILYPKIYEIDPSNPFLQRSWKSFVLIFLQMYRQLQTETSCFINDPPLTSILASVEIIWQQTRLRILNSRKRDQRSPTCMSSQQSFARSKLDLLLTFSDPSIHSFILVAWISWGHQHSNFNNSKDNIYSAANIATALAAKD